VGESFTWIASIGTGTCVVIPWKPVFAAPVRYDAFNNATFVARGTAGYAFITGSFTYRLNGVDTIVDLGQNVSDAHHIYLDSSKLVATLPDIPVNAGMVSFDASMNWCGFPGVEFDVSVVIPSSSGLSPSTLPPISVATTVPGGPATTLPGGGSGLQPFSSPVNYLRTRFSDPANPNGSCINNGTVSAVVKMIDCGSSAKALKFTGGTSNFKIQQTFTATPSCLQLGSTPSAQIDTDGSVSLAGVWGDCSTTDISPTGQVFGSYFSAILNDGNQGNPAVAAPWYTIKLTENYPGWNDPCLSANALPGNNGVSGTLSGTPVIQFRCSATPVTWQQWAPTESFPAGPPASPPPTPTDAKAFDDEIQTTLRRQSDLRCVESLRNDGSVVVSTTAIDPGLCLPIVPTLVAGGWSLGLAESDDQCLSTVGARIVWGDCSGSTVWVDALVAPENVSFSLKPAGSSACFGVSTTGLAELTNCGAGTIWYDDGPDAVKCMPKTQGTISLANASAYVIAAQAVAFYEKRRSHKNYNQLLETLSNCGDIIRTLKQSDGSVYPKEIAKWNPSLAGDGLGFVVETDAFVLSPYEESIYNYMQLFYTNLSSARPARDLATETYSSLLRLYLERAKAISVEARIAEIDAAEKIMRSGVNAPTVGSYSEMIRDFTDVIPNYLENYIALGASGDEITTTSYRERLNTFTQVYLQQMTDDGVICRTSSSCLEFTNELLVSFPANAKAQKEWINESFEKVYVYCFKTGNDCIREAKQDARVKVIMFWLNVALLVLDVFITLRTVTAPLRVRPVELDPIAKSVTDNIEPVSNPSSPPTTVAYTTRSFQPKQTLGDKEVYLGSKGTQFEIDYDFVGPPTRIGAKGQTIDVNTQGLTNLQKMLRGCAPISKIDGRPIELHHMTQTENSALVTLSREFHDANYDTIHIYRRGDPTYRSGINRSKFGTSSKAVWFAVAQLSTTVILTKVRGLCT
jgi:A nuclease of the HNH/ENDO VII superfamily with conserved LHH